MRSHPARMRALAAVFIATLMLAACAGNSEDGAGGGDTSGDGQATEGGGETSGDPIRVGVVLSLSGAIAPLGQAARAGIEYAVEEINSAGGVQGRPLEVVVRDDQSEQDVASTTAQRLMGEDVVALLGGSFGSTANAIGSLTEREQMPFVTPTGVVVDAQLEWQYTYFTLANFEEVARAMLGYAEEKGWERVGLLRLSREYGEIGSRYLNQVAGDHGVEIVAEEQGADADTDFTAQLTKIRSADPDALIIWFANPAGAIALQNMAQVGMDVPVIAPLSMANSALIDVAGEAAEGVVVQAQLIPDEPLPRQEEFVSAFTDAVGEEPETFEAVGYDLVHILAAALEEVDDPTDREQLRAALENVSYEGAGTVVSYGEGQHQPEPEAIVLTQVRDGEFVQAE